MTLNHFAQFFLLPHCRDRISACIHASDLLDGCTLKYLEYDLIKLLEHIKASAQAMDGRLNFFKDIGTFLYREILKTPLLLEQMHPIIIRE